MTGAEAKHISVAGGGKVKLKETKADSMGIFGGIRTELSGTSLEKLTLFSGEEAEDTLLRFLRIRKFRRSRWMAEKK